jgi:hypothetical protein
MEKQNVLDLLPFIDPSALDYTEWTAVGMALKEEGYTAADWDEWSRRDASRYHPGECFKKWSSFNGTETPITGGTIVQMARDHGWEPVHETDGHELDWDAIIGGKDDLVIINKNWIEGREVIEPAAWNPAGELAKYLEILFQSTENVGYVTDSWEKDGRYMPTKGVWDRTAGELIQQLNKCKGDIGSVIGDYKPEVGAWIRFNPLDGAGCKNENVTDFRFALVESDAMDIDQQNAIIRELELPVACLVHSGKKSLHAIVRVDAANYEEYRKRVDYLYNVCQKNGLKIDSQNRNPSRLSRMPGIMRSGQKQFLVDANIGKASWVEWHEWIEGINDDLPEPENLINVWDNLPALSLPLINNVLRQGHKMLLAGPSKAGKSYALIELCCAIAEGKKWLQWTCTKGKIMYVNLELDRASCLHRFRDVYQALGWQPDNLANIDIWNLRGKAVPMDRLAPKLIRRAQKKSYIAIIIDPIYKVITGDENSADQMAHFCNQFDRVCTDLGAAVIYCHHHSKGQQGAKRSMDRASGSGVFARDPDVLLDLIELEMTEAILKQEENKAVCAVCIEALERLLPTYIDDRVSQDDVCSSKAMTEHCHGALTLSQLNDLKAKIAETKQVVHLRSAWRIDGTLREFPKFPPINVWFDYPIHTVDMVGSLKDIEPEGDRPPWQKAMEKRKPKEAKEKDRNISLENAFEACGMNGEITIDSLAEYMGVTVRTIWRYIKEHGGFETEKKGEGIPSIVRRRTP